MPELSRTDGYFGLGLSCSISAGFSTWNSKYVWFVLATPPTTPVPVPPFTPFPLKSASLVTAFERSISGILMSILRGARRTWKPFGGGGLTMTSFGGGGLSGTLGGSFFISTNWIFSDFAFSSLAPARAVAYTAALIRTVWSTM